VINPEDWTDFLDSGDTLPAKLIYDPSGVQSPTFDIAANATNCEIFYASDTGYPADGPVSITVLIDTTDSTGQEHRETLHYVGRVIGGEVFQYDPQLYPVRTCLY
jgi:hypothetical protein